MAAFASAGGKPAADKSMGLYGNAKDYYQRTTVAAEAGGGGVAPQDMSVVDGLGGDPLKSELGGGSAPAGRLGSVGATLKGVFGSLLGGGGGGGSGCCANMKKRYSLAWMASLGFFISFGIRCNMGVAIIPMTSNRTVTPSYPDFEDESEENMEREMNASVAPIQTLTSTPIVTNETYEYYSYYRPLEPEFKWSPETIGVVDSSFFWGYILTQVPGGYLAARYPANKIFGGALTISAFLNLFLPATAKIHFTVVMLFRIMQGLVEGTTYPAAHGIWRHWAPPLERSRLATICFCGSYAGAVAGLGVSGFLTDHFGWQSGFYFYGVVGILWGIYWWWNSYEKPSIHPTITEEERNYIESSIGEQPQPFGKGCQPPWKAMFLSMPVWAIIVANFARSWSFYLFIISQPKYFKDAFKFQMTASGILSALPHAVMALIVPIGGHFADDLRRKGTLSTTNVRKIFNCGGFGLEAFFLLLLAFSKTTFLSIFFLTIAVGFSGFAISGFNVNHLDIAPRYASILMGISNGFGTLAGILCPIVVQLITKHETLSDWRWVFVIASVIHFSGITFYGMFASGEKQPWADPPGAQIDGETWRPTEGGAAPGAGGTPFTQALPPPYAEGDGKGQNGLHTYTNPYNPYATEPSAYQPGPAQSPGPESKTNPYRSAAPPQAGTGATTENPFVNRGAEAPTKNPFRP